MAIASRQGIIVTAVLTCILYITGIAVTLGLILPTGKSNMSNPLTTHVLDTSIGKPANDLPIKLFYDTPNIGWKLLSEGKTNSDGRLPNLITDPGTFVKGTYKLYFDTASYFKQQNITGFYPYVDIVFEITSPGEHYHVPLLLNPYGYSTYRGS
ncbi:5-hydroxyisourate hydrolase-like [Tubulanus polymorphus]|uniref:5-hydroxyisourate hydrolase-like n=1 Tax=Tubulanus polymorphus TaxID=672921 RepID=UPI003DA5E844